jgi:hypothetical protein
MNVQDQISLVEKEVINHFNKNAKYTGIASPDLFADEQRHIIEIGTSILCTKWKIGYEGGSFVQSFVNNDLMGAIGRADSTTYKGFKFFASLMYNVGKPIELCRLESNLN